MTIEQEIEQLVLKCIALDGLKACPKDLAFLEKYGLKNLYFFSLEYAMEGTDTTVLDSKAKGLIDLGLRDKNSGMEFEVGNIFIDGDVLLLRMTLTNRTQIGYTTDFMRFYIQDAKIRKKTAVQQLEQNILFTFDYPEEIPAHESRTFTVAMNKFTIPDKKRLIIEIDPGEERRPAFPVQTEEQVAADSRGGIQKQKATGNGG